MAILTLRPGVLHGDLPHEAVHGNLNPHVRRFACMIA